MGGRRAPVSLPERAPAARADAEALRRRLYRPAASTDDLHAYLDAAVPIDRRAVASAPPARGRRILPVLLGAGGVVALAIAAAAAGAVQPSAPPVRPVAASASTAAPPVPVPTIDSGAPVVAAVTDRDAATRALLGGAFGTADPAAAARAQDQLAARLRQVLLPRATDTTRLLDMAGESAGGGRLTLAPQDPVTLLEGGVLVIETMGRAPGSATWRVYGLRAEEHGQPHVLERIVGDPGHRLAAAVVRLSPGTVLSAVSVEVRPTTPFLLRAEVHDARACDDLTIGCTDVGVGNARAVRHAVEEERTRTATPTPPS